MIVTAWNNGGTGYGVKIAQQDRDRFFKKEWKTVVLELGSSEWQVEVNTDKRSFWSGTCRELINKEIGEWLVKNRLAPWPPGEPPKLVLEPLSDRHFRRRKP